MLDQIDHPLDNNRALLVLCDSRQENSYAEVKPSLLDALDHWGMPYVLYDLAHSTPATLFDHYAAVVLAQQSLGLALNDDIANAIAQAVANGLGYIGGDASIGYLPIPLQQMLGVSVQDVQPALETHLIDGSHFVSQWQVQGIDPFSCRYRFRRPVEMAIVLPTMPRVRVLLESGEYPALWVTQYGNGRVVQWALPPALWRREVFGHGEGLDDLLWRSIVWAARKPFAMLDMPPFSTAVVGDAVGSHDFAWIETLYGHGFPPNVGVFPDDVDAHSEVRGQSGFFDRPVEAMRRYTQARQAEFFPHAATWNRAYLLYARADGSEIPTNELTQRLSAVDKQFTRYGIAWARTANPHYEQLGYHAVSLLQKRGVQFTLGSYLPGETVEGEHHLWGGTPYNHPGFTIAPLPEAADFYVVTSGRPHLETTIPTGPDTYRLRQEAYAVETDLMWGRTRWQNQCRFNDWDAMAEAAVRQVRLGLNALFWANPSTSEQTIAFVSPSEWQALWEQVARRISRYERWPALYSDIAAYAQAKHRTRLVGVHSADRSLICTLEGNPDVPLYIHIWDDLGDGERVICRYEQIQAFSNTERVVFSA